MKGEIVLDLKGSVLKSSSNFSDDDVQDISASVFRFLQDVSLLEKTLGAPADQFKMAKLTVKNHEVGIAVGDQEIKILFYNLE